MSQPSRLKKYENLRNQIQTNTEENRHTESFSNIANKLNQLEPTEFKAVDVTKDTVDAAHIRKRSFENTTTPQEPVFHNEYLDEVIEEVKKYNIRKGLRTFDNTQMNILSEINGKVVKPIVQEDIEPLLVEDMVVSDEETKNSIKSHIMKFLNGADDDDVTEEVVIQESIEKENYEQQLQEERNLREKVMEETQRLKVQIEEYEEDLDEMSEKVSNTNKLLNLILVFLVIALIVIIAVAIYWALTTRGSI